ncbi:MAG: selenoneine biosynthesis selenosugar synthase SenB [Candidatus Anammoxibacter sp.]
MTPEPKHSLKGNSITAIRWARLLRELGHKVIIQQTYNEEYCDFMIALHAKRSFNAIERFSQLRFHRLQQQKPLVVVLTGTDLYNDIRANRKAQKSIELADRLVVLQQMGIMELPKEFRKKTRVIYQSSTQSSAKLIKLKRSISKRKRTFDVAVIGHLRHVKDPFRAALASRQLPATSKVRILHLGSALDDKMKEKAQQEMVRNPRYCWLQKQPRGRTIKILSDSRLLVLSSRMEGGANVIAEAIIAGVPVLASKIPGNIGMLGTDYPGYFPVGDSNSLASLILRSENDPEFLKVLKQKLKLLVPRFKPEMEKSSLKKLLKEFS